MLAPQRELLIYGATARPKKAVTAAATVSLPWPRRGDLSALLRRHLEAPGAPARLSWKRLRAATLPWYLALVDELLAREWFALRVVVGLNEEARVEALVGKSATGQPPPPVRYRVRVAGKPPEGAVLGDTRYLRLRDTPALQVARFLATALQAAYGARKAGKAQTLFLAHLGKKAGVADLTVLGGRAGARLGVWRPHELTTTTTTTAA